MIVKKCIYCDKEFSPKRLSTAMSCSGYCNLKQWRLKNREHNNQIKRDWRRRNGIVEKGSAEHREQVAEWMRGRYVGENHRRWRGGYRNHLMHNRDRRIIKKSAEGVHTLEQWEDLKHKFDYACLRCRRVEPEITLSEDHIIPLSKGGSNNIDNIQPLCRSCNSSKNDRVIDYTKEMV